MKDSMRLITSALGDQKTFRLIPVDVNCPYSEGIYDSTNKVLVLIGNIKKETFQMTPKLDENGDPMPVKGKRLSGKQYREERRTMNTLTEYYVLEKEEIMELVDILASNRNTYDYKKYMVDSRIITAPEKKIELINP